MIGLEAAKTLLASNYKLQLLSSSHYFDAKDDEAVLRQEYVQDDEISKVLDDLITNNPHLADYITMPDDVPYYLNYVEAIKKFNPKIWRRFLTMLVKTKDEIENIINKKGV